MSSNIAIEVIKEHREPRAGPDVLTVAAAQLSGPWLAPAARLSRAIAAAEVAAAAGAQLVAYPETYLCGYPFWLPRTDGASFNHPDHKDCYAYYLDTAIHVDGPQVAELCTAASDLGITMVIGASERGHRQGEGTIWCTLLTIDPRIGVAGHHRKLVPTYDERLVWAHGDGAGLRTHRVGTATVGSLNCWENWMPQARTALYSQGETVHISAWPGSTELTRDITRFVAAEGRLFSVAVSGLITADTIPADFPLAEQLRSACDDVIFDGGSAVAGPDGAWLIPPVPNVEGLLIADLDPEQVARERLTFDPTGHYARPDVLHTTVDRSRRAAVTFDDPSPDPT
ncbi:carbon-nitrogen hydrolase family protein [Mycolicibacterium palauense]|uniref:carbon-nitrogen hydrolase family protein n=1 Tax=Mycolicibacterium palauense TaxID=2034511 RepID=UPI001FE709C3|nr:carbon-nitrogen hydrolase family protein [Mycolicibacterium palauense]